MTYQGFDLIGVTQEEFVEYCKRHNVSPSQSSTKRKFFRRVAMGKIIRNEKGVIVDVRRKNAKNISEEQTETSCCDTE